MYCVGCMVLLTFNHYRFKANFLAAFLYMMSVWADFIYTTLPWSNGRLSPGDCRLNKFHNSKGTDVIADLLPLSLPSSLSGRYCFNRLFGNMRWNM